MLTQKLNSVSRFRTQLLLSDPQSLSDKDNLITVHEKFLNALQAGLQNGDIIYRTDGIYRSRLVTGEQGRRVRVDGFTSDLYGKFDSFRVFRLESEKGKPVEVLERFGSDNKTVINTDTLLHYLTKQNSQPPLSPVLRPDAEEEAMVRPSLAFRGLRSSAAPS